MIFKRKACFSRNEIFGNYVIGFKRKLLFFSVSSQLILLLKNFAFRIIINYHVEIQTVKIHIQFLRSNSILDYVSCLKTFHEEVKD